MRSNFFNIHPVYEDDDNILLFWQKKISKNLFLFLLIFCAIPYLFSVKYAFETDEWYRIVFYTLVYLWGFVITFVDKIPFTLRVWSGLTAFYLLGLFSLISTGLVGSTRGYLLCFSAFAAIFCGMQAGIFAIIVNIFTLTVVGVLFFNGILNTDAGQWPGDAGIWIIITSTFAFLSAMVTLVLASIIKAVDVSAREYKHLIKNTSDIIWTMDNQYRINFINDAVFPILGYTPAEVTGRPLAQFIDRFTPSFLEPMETDGRQTAETVMVHKKGHLVDVDFSCSKINPFPKTQSVYQGIIRDISQKKILEREERQLKDRLAQAEKISALGVLAGSVAHDLNNILSGIATYPEILLMNDDVDPKIKQGLTLIKESGKKASAVVSDLLTISKGANAEKEILNLNAIIDRYTLAHDFKNIEALYPQISIEVITDPELLNFSGSYIHIEKTIMNLVLNAVEEVSQQIDGRVAIATQNMCIDSSTSGYDDIPPGEYVILQVRDNGSGIDEQHIQSVFDPFFTKKKMGKSGTGLGLTVVWNAVQDHNGHIFVRSDRNGTCFEILFPAVRKAVKPKKPTWSIDEIKGNREMILVVDDLKEQRDIALTILESLGYKAQAVDNGYEAVEFIKVHPTDLVILDMIMEPSISGLETFRLLKQVNPGQKAIIASGYSKSKEVNVAQELGAGRFIKKPYTVMDMGIAIREELEK